MSIVASMSAASSALAAAQAGMTVTSQNVAGAAVEGYSRRRSELVVSSLAPDSKALWGTSFAVDGFVRDYSRLIERQRLEKIESVSRTSVFVNSTATIDTLVIDPSSSVAPALNRFFSAAGALARETDTPSLRAEFRGAAEALADRIRTTAESVDAVRGDAVIGLDETLAESNRVAAQLVDVNREIYLAGGGDEPGPSADLLDRRDQILRTLRGLVGGEERIEADGTASLYVQGQPLVDRLVQGRLGVVRVGEQIAAGGSLTGDLPVGTMYMDLTDRTARGENTADVRIPIARLTDGTAGAYATLLFDTVPRYAGQLDKLARDVADAVNGVANADGTPISAVFDFRRDVGAPRLALDMVSVVASNPAAVNIDAQAAKAIEAGPPGGAAVPLRNVFARQWSGFVSTVSTDVLRWKAENESSTALGAQLDAQRESISGVNLDEEAANLLRFQQMYAAASKVIQMGSQMFDDLLNAMN